MDIDFKKVLEENKDFSEFSKMAVFDAFSTFNPSLIPTMWAMYQSGMPWQQAANALKMMIRYGGGPNDNTRRDR